MTKTIQRHWQHLTGKTQDEDNPETLATFDRQDTGLRQSRDIGNIWHCECLWIVFVMCLTCQMLPMSLDCLCHVSYLSNAANVSGLSSSCVLSVKCCQCLWIVFVLYLVCQMLPMSLDYRRPVSCLSNVTNISGLSSSCVLSVKCCQCLWIVLVLCLACPKTIQRNWQHLTGKTQDEDNPETLATFDRQDTGLRQSRDIGNIWQTRHRTKTIQRYW
jgi:hypothetical protein